MDLHGKTVLLTGASRGLGPHVARALARRGANLVLTARSAEALAGVAEEMRSLGVQSAALPGDVTDSSSRQEVLRQARQELGPIDVLINNAGVESISAYTDLSAEAIESIVQTNLLAPLLLSRLALPEMTQRGCGHVVMMSSLGGKKGSPYSATYASTKAALIAWSAALREELRGSGVSTSVICPGFVSDAGMFADYRKRAPRIAGETTPQKVADAVVRAIERDVAEIIVNPGPVRLMLLADALHPAIMTRVLRWFGVYEFFRQQAKDNASEEDRR